MAADPGVLPRRRITMPPALVRAADRIERDDTARRASWLIWPVGALVFLWVGRHQWFIRDDWAFLFSRDRFRETGGLDSMLLTPQDGHWMTWPILVFHAIRGVFGIGSYLPYLAVLWLTHAGIVLLARAWMRRLGVSAWTTTLMTGVLFVFGAGWENLLFAVQIVYNFSLLAFLAHTLLVDHEGPVDRRDVVGSVLAVIGVSSSGFGPFFGFGVGLLLALRRRWTAALVAVVPQAVAWLWWWFTWGADPAGEPGNAGPRFVWSFVQQGVWATFGSLTGTAILAWPAFLLCIAMIVWPHTGAARRVPMIAMMATTLVMFAGIGLRREVFGVLAAGWPRYQYMAAMMIAPALAVGLDQARRFAPWAKWLPRLVLVVALGRNVLWLDDGGDYWSSLSSADRRIFSLVAASDERLTVPPDGFMTAPDASPDVQIRNLDALVESGAIEPRPAVTPDEQAILRAAIEQARVSGLLPPP